MKIKYFGTSWEIGLTLSATIYNRNGVMIGTSHPLTETALESGIYISDEINNSIGIMPRGIYVSVVTNVDGERMGFDEFAWDGANDINKETIDAKLWNELEKMQVRDALGVDGDKVVASEGQLQKKSEYPHNSTIDTNTIHDNDDTTPPI